jgi:hypothetical protein
MISPVASAVQSHGPGARRTGVSAAGHELLPEQTKASGIGTLPGLPPMTLGNMRRLGVRRLAIYCLNHVYRHQTIRRSSI